MLTRRAFLQTTVATGVGTLAGVNGLRADKYDLVIRGGRVIDPARRLDNVMDVAVSAGRIAAVLPPGEGADRISEVVAVAMGAPNRVRILLNVARTGILSDGELMDIDRVDVAAARRAIERHCDVIVVVKARISRSVAGTNDLEALRRAQAIVGPFRMRVMVHVGDTASPLPAILALLKPGDIVTHVYSPPPHGVFDDSGLVLPEVLAARRRGIRFDIGNGRVGHITWEVAEQALRQKFLPDTISSDWTDAARTDQVFDFPNVPSKFLLLGMSLDQVIERATINAAHSFPVFGDLGTLRVGAAADLAILELRIGAFEFVDNTNTPRKARAKLFTHASVFAGKLVRRAS